MVLVAAVDLLSGRRPSPGLNRSAPKKHGSARHGHDSRCAERTRQLAVKAMSWHRRVLFLGHRHINGCYEILSAVNACGQGKEKVFPGQDIDSGPQKLRGLGQESYVLVLG